MCNISEKLMYLGCTGPGNVVCMGRRGSVQSFVEKARRKEANRKT
jgi:hypothetical protein